MFRTPKDFQGSTSSSTVSRRSMRSSATDWCSSRRRRTQLSLISRVCLRSSARSQRLYAMSSRETEANWKIVLEGFLEGYHIRVTHPETFFPYGFDNLNVIEQIGPHSRVTFPFRRIEKLAAVPSEERRVMGFVTFVYQIFPNALVTVLSNHTNLLVLEPLSVDRTGVISYSLTNRSGDTAEALEAATRDAQFTAIGATKIGRWSARFSVASLAMPTRALSSAASRVQSSTSIGRWVRRCRNDLHRSAIVERKAERWIARLHRPFSTWPAKRQRKRESDADVIARSYQPKLLLIEMRLSRVRLGCTLSLISSLTYAFAICTGQRLCASFTMRTITSLRLTS